MKIATTLLFTLYVTLTFAQEGTYHILHPQENRNTGKILKTMYIQIKEHAQLEKVAIISTKKGEMGMPFKLDKVATQKVQKNIFSYSISFLAQYDADSYISFDVKGITAEGKLQIAKPNYYSRDKETLKRMTNTTIEKFAQQIFLLIK